MHEFNKLLHKMITLNGITHDCISRFNRSVKPAIISESVILLKYSLFLSIIYEERTIVKQFKFLFQGCCCLKLGF